MNEELDVFLEGLIHGATPSVSASVVSSSKILYEKVAGYRQVEPTRLPVLQDTLYDLASLTKVVGVTTALLRLLDKGLATLDMTIGDCFPDSGNFAKVTVRQLATHTGGFVPERRLWNFLDDPKDAIPFILHDTPVAEPGTHVIYSCFGFIILGKMLEQTCGKSLQGIIQEEVTGPLGMQHTFYRPSTYGEFTYAATEYPIVGEVHDENARFLGGVSGNAGLFSTLQDLERFCMALLSHKRGFLSDKAFQLLTSLQAKGEEHRSIGWKLDDLALFGTHTSNLTIGHTGFTGTSLVLDFSRNRAAILLTNRIHPTRDNKMLLALRRDYHNLVFA